MKPNIKAYHWYLDTPAWHKKRGERFRFDKGRCQHCGAPATEVHHVSYGNVYDETLFDLISLCRRCHQKIHDRCPANDNQLRLPVRLYRASG